MLESIVLNSDNVLQQQKSWLLEVYDLKWASSQDESNDCLFHLNQTTETSHVPLHCQNNKNKNKKRKIKKKIDKRKRKMLVSKHTITLYKIKKIIPVNIVKLELSESVKIHSVVNISKKII